jgi:hypothetical protein
MEVREDSYHPYPSFLELFLVQRFLLFFGFQLLQLSFSYNVVFLQVSDWALAEILDFRRARYFPPAAAPMHAYQPKNRPKYYFLTTKNNF